jgi:hypothetical protein
MSSSTSSIQRLGFLFKVPLEASFLLKTIALYFCCRNASKAPTVGRTK